MTKKRTQFVCQSCGYRSPKWLGRCPACGQWDSLVEETRTTPSVTSTLPPTPLSLTELVSSPSKRLSTGLYELDQVLGGGLVPGSLVLLGGDPGIGKSTLLLQVMHNISKTCGKVLYLSGEESAEQIKIRAHRLGVEAAQIYLLAETNLELALAAVEQLQPKVLVVDSIQTVFLPEITSAPGSVAQVRECAARLLNVAKGKNIATFLVGHVTKEGALAGPRVLEHLVDTVLYFEGERGAPFRLLRAVKNRFGSTNEIGVFEMTDKGLCPVDNPSEIFISQSTMGIAGSVITATIEGTRPVLVEVQALVTNTPLAVPRRTSVGFDPQRLAMLAAILEKRLGLNFYNRDIYLNVVGGLKLTEPGADLAVVLALATSYLDRPLPKESIVFGEVGLTGEIRPVTQALLRLKEAARLGFKRAFIPASNSAVLKNKVDIQLLCGKNLAEILEFI